jgi:hypothetical protein
MSVMPSDGLNPTITATDVANGSITVYNIIVAWPAPPSFYVTGSPSYKPMGGTSLAVGVEPYIVC